MTLLFLEGTSLCWYFYLQGLALQQHYLHQIKSVFCHISFDSLCSWAWAGSTPGRVSCSLHGFFGTAGEMQDVQAGTLRAVGSLFYLQQWQTRKYAAASSTRPPRVCSRRVRANKDSDKQQSRLRVVTVLTSWREMRKRQRKRGKTRKWLCFSFRLTG